MTVQTFTVASDRLLGHSHGSQIKADDLGGTNVAALVSAGHLVPDEPQPKADPAISKKEQ